MSNAKILIAEDTPDLLELMADRLTFEGYTVIKTRDGQEAWERIQQEDPDIILLDLMMPRMDGYEVLERVRKNPPSPKYQPVIIISAKGELADMKKGFSLEADHYITKPWEIRDILKGIRMALKLARIRDVSPDG